MHKHNTVIEIDGIVNEPVWDEVEPLGLAQKVPDAGAPPTQKTEIRITYDETFLYLSGRMYDDAPGRIIANTKKRDDFTENTEWCGLLIDSYNDRENALAFFVTPTGAKLDMALSNDIEGPAAFNVSWNAFWDAAATRNEQGWFAEIRIPFSSLPFEVQEGKAVMGITAWRYLARNDETDIYPPRDPALGSSFKPSLTQRFVFEGIDTQRPIYITPYTLGGMAVANALTPTTDAYERYTNLNYNVGLDAKVALRSNLTLDLTVNTDFAQVEADDQQVNLTRLNLFFPEKRLFFQERASLFDFNFGTTDKVFHSRRIGIVNGEQARIYGGVRAFGRLGRWEAGLLNMQTGAHKGQSGENFGVFRVRRNVLNDNSTIGAILTSRADLEGRYNTVYGVDATLRVHKQHYAVVRVAQSASQDASPARFSLAPTKFYLGLEKRSLDQFTYNINFGRAGQNYTPRLGFEQRENFAQFNHITAYNAFPGKGSGILQYGPYLTGSWTWSNATNTLESRSVLGGFQLLTKSGWTYDFQYQKYREVLLAPLEFPGRIKIAEGTYGFSGIQSTVTTSSVGRLSYSASLEAGQFYNGTKVTLSLAPFFNITPDFVIEGRYDYNRLSMPAQPGATHVQVSQLKLLYTFSTKIALSGLVQHNNLARLLFGSVRVRYNPKEGSDFYVVFNGDLNQDRQSVYPTLPASNNSVVFIKYSYTFHL